MRIGDEQLVDEVLFLHRGRGLAAPAAPLRLVRRHRLGFRIAAVRQRDDDVLLLDEVFERQIRMKLDDLGTTLVAVLRLDVFELGANHRQQPFRPREDVAEILDLQQQLLELGDDLVLLQRGKAIQTQVEDRLCLHLGQPIAFGLEPELLGQVIRAGHHFAGARQHLRHGARRPRTAHQCDLGLGRRRRSLDEGDHLIDVGERDRLSFEDVRALARLAHVVHRAPRDDLAAMAHERFEHLLEVAAASAGRPAAPPC